MTYITEEQYNIGIKNGICLVTFYSRLKKGWSYEEAATKPLLRKVI